MSILEAKHINVLPSSHALVFHIKFLLHAEKHGTCSSPVARDEYGYFLTTLNVYFKYNVTVSLQLMLHFSISPKVNRSD